MPTVTHSGQTDDTEGSSTGDVSTLVSTSVDNEIALFSGTGGKTLKRATTTGLLKAAAGVLTAAVAGTDYYAPGGTDVALADGGTGASTAATARTNLGLGAISLLATVTEADITLADNTTNNSSTTKHGYLKKLSNSATDFMDGTGNWDTIKDSDLSTSDITTNDATTSKHGFLPKLPGGTTTFLRADGSYATPSGAGDVSSNTATSVANEIALFTDTTGKSIKRSTGSGVAILTSGVLSASDWTTFTPSWANLTVGNGTNTGRYVQIGKTVIVKIRFIMGSTSSMGSAPTLTLPVTSISTGYNGAVTEVGRSTILDNGSAVFYGLVRWESTTTVSAMVQNVSATYLVGNNITSTVPMTWTTLDELHMNFIYEAP